MIFVTCTFHSYGWEKSLSSILEIRYYNPRQLVCRITLIHPRIVIPYIFYGQYMLQGTF